MQEIIQNILKQEADAIQNIPISKNFEKTIELLHSCVHINGGKLITSGVGKAGEIAHSIATTFSSTGTPAVYLRPVEAQHGDIGVVGKNDVLLLVSNSGKTREILELIELTQNLHSHIPVIAISSNVDSPLGKKANLILETGNPNEICPLGLTPTTSTTTMTVIGDILVVLMMQKINFTREEYAKRHHGGYLGQKSRSDE